MTSGPNVLSWDLAGLLELQLQLTLHYFTQSNCSSIYVIHTQVCVFSQGTLAHFVIMRCCQRAQGPQTPHQHFPGLSAQGPCPALSESYERDRPGLHKHMPMLSSCQLGDTAAASQCIAYAVASHLGVFLDLLQVDALQHVLLRCGVVKGAERDHVVAGDALVGQPVVLRDSSPAATVGPPTRLERVNLHCRQWSSISAGYPTSKSASSAMEQHQC